MHIYGDTRKLSVTYSYVNSLKGRQLLYVPFSKICLKCLSLLEYERMAYLSLTPILNITIVLDSGI